MNLAAVANTNPFDSAVSASSGDVWAQSVDPTASYTPVSIGPGQTRTITLTFTPNAPKGTWSAASSAWTPSTCSRSAATN